MDDEEQKELKEQQTHEKELADAREKELRDTEKRAIEAEARAKAMQEAMDLIRGGGQQQQAQPWTDEQWEEFKDKFGFTKEQVGVMSNLVNTGIDKVRMEFEEKHKATSQEAKEAKERLDAYEKNKGYESAKKNLFKSRPELTRHEEEIDSFVKDYPKEMREDPEKLKDILAKAEVYLKGKIGEKMLKSDASGSARFGRGEPEDAIEITPDTEGMRDYEKTQINRIVPKREKLEDLSKFKDPMMGDGISISGRDEFDRISKNPLGRK